MQIHSRLSLSAHPSAFMLLDTWIDGQRMDVGLVRRWSVTGGGDGAGMDALADVEGLQQAVRLLRARLERRSPCCRLHRLMLGDVADPHDIETRLCQTLGQCAADDALLVICTRRDAHARALRTLHLRAGSFMPGLDLLDAPVLAYGPSPCTTRAAAGTGRPVPVGGRRRTDRCLLLTG